MGKRFFAFGAAVAIVAGMLALRAAPALSESNDAANVRLSEFWTGVPSDDEQVGKYDSTTGLGTFVDCSDSPNASGKHDLRVQFSYSQTTRTVPFYADIIQDGSGQPKPAFHSVLDADHTSVTYTKQISDCDDKYTLYIGYPKHS